MPRSMSTASARRPSASRCSSPAAKSVRMNRVREDTSAASSANRSSATGSRSRPTSSPSGPSRSAIRRAWPPPPNVQSTTTSPGRGSSTSSTASTRTGSWVAVMSRRLTKLRGDVGDLVGEGGVERGPGGAIPDLEGVLGADDDHVLAEAGVLHEGRGDHDAAGAVELAGEGVGGKEEAKAASLGREWVQPLEGGRAALVVVAGAPELDALLDALGEDG